MEADQKLLLLGGGYTLKQLIGIIAKERPNTAMIVTTRDETKAHAIRSDTVIAEVVRTPADLAGVLDSYPSIVQVVDSIPPPDGDSTGYADVVSRHFATRPVSTILYLSTTGVYERNDGEWVAESDQVAPSQERLKARIAVEQVYASLRAGLQAPRVTSVRPSAIYGPERGLHQALLQGRFPRIQGDRWSNRIHVTDLAYILYDLLFVVEGQLPEAVNAADEEPTLMSEVVEAYCTALGVSLPPEITVEEARTRGSGMATLLGSQRVDTSLLRSLRSRKLLFPNYRSGLRDLVKVA